MDRFAVVDRIEAAIQRDVGRNIAPLFSAARGGLRGAISALARGDGPVELITGFFVPGGTPPSAETDGPVAAALVARGLTAVGISCRLATDAPCSGACAAALEGAGVANITLDVAPLNGSADHIVAAWQADGVRHALAIERCGRTRDGTARNMRGRDMSDWTTLLDDLFLAGPWGTIAVGDGGNEIGMGALPLALIADHIDNGATIACATPATHLIVAGVSHWGAYALLGGLAAIRADWRAPLLECLNPDLDRAILEATVRNGPAVDGIGGRQTMTIDGLDGAAHADVLRTVRSLVIEI